VYAAVADFPCAPPVPRVPATTASAAALILCAAPAEAQPNNVPKIIAESVGAPLRLAEGEFLSLAEAMPAEKYSFVPSVPGDRASVLAVGPGESRRPQPEGA
jgi:hypothetical protein